MEHQQAQQQQQFLTLEGLENSNARVLVVKLINILLTLLQVSRKKRHIGQDDFLIYSFVGLSSDYCNRGRDLNSSSADQDTPHFYCGRVHLFHSGVHSIIGNSRCVAPLGLSNDFNPVFIFQRVIVVYGRSGSVGTKLLGRHQQLSKVIFSFVNCRGHKMFRRQHSSESNIIIISLRYSLECIKTCL